MERKCIICGRKERVKYKRITDSGRYYHICNTCKSKGHKEENNSQPDAKPV